MSRRATVRRDGAADAAPPDDELAGWWRDAERLACASPREQASRQQELFGDRPAWQGLLARASVCELRRLLDEGERALDEAAPRDRGQPWASVGELVARRLAHARRGAEATRETIAWAQRRATELPAEEAATVGRLRHLEGALLLRFGEADAAEAALLRALELVGDAPCRAWVLDGIASVHQLRGAWIEARRTLQATNALKLDAGDALGHAIGAGNLAFLELGLGRVAAAAHACTAALARRETDLPEQTRGRLCMLRCQALIEAGALDEAASGAADLETLVSASGSVPASVRGFAALVLARLAAARSPDGAGPWLKEAEPLLRSPYERAHWVHWRARLEPETRAEKDVLAELAELAAGMGGEGEPHWLTRMALARSAAAAGCRDDARDHLVAALDVASRRNRWAWLARTDELFREVDPAAHAAHLARRFTGLDSRELEVTRRESATIVFADLEGFTSRSRHLPPELVQETVAGLFEMSVALLVRHRVAPLQHLGDGLLALARGEGHEGRGLAFALDYVRVTDRATRVRQALGEELGLRLRAGVASGDVVTGPLGSPFHREHLAIGLPTNIAARLQGQARPGEVMVAERTAETAGVDGAREHLSLKGLDESFPARRIVAVEADSS